MIFSSIRFIMIRANFLNIFIVLFNKLLKTSTWCEFTTSRLLHYNTNNAHTQAYKFNIQILTWCCFWPECQNFAAKCNYCLFSGWRYFFFSLKHFFFMCQSIQTTMTSTLTAKWTISFFKSPSTVVHKRSSAMDNSAKNPSRLIVHQESFYMYRGILCT